MVQFYEKVTTNLIRIAQHEAQCVRVMDLRIIRAVCNTKYKIMQG